jgi:hypothetical protein
MRQPRLSKIGAKLWACLEAQFRSKFASKGLEIAPFGLDSHLIVQRATAWRPATSRRF